jgi:hypothetical protein
MMSMIFDGFNSMGAGTKTASLSFFAAGFRSRASARANSPAACTRRQIYERTLDFSAQTAYRVQQMPDLRHNSRPKNADEGA